MILPSAIPAQTRQAFRWDATAGLLFGLYSGMTLPFLAVIARDQLQATNFQISVIAASPFAGYLFALFWASHIHTRPKMPYAVGFGITARSLLLLMFFAANAQTYVLIVLGAMMIEMFTPTAYTTLMRDIYPDQYRATLMGYVRTAMVATTILGAAGAGWLLNSVSYRHLFPAAALIGVASSLCFSRIRIAQVVEPSRLDLSMLRSFAILRDDRVFGLFVLAMFVFGFGILISAPLMPILQVDQLHITPRWVGLLAMVGSAFSGTFYFLWGRFIDRRSPTKALLITMFVASLISLVYAIAHHVPTLLLAAICAGIAYSGMELALLIFLTRIPERDQIPYYAGLLYSAIGVRGLIAPFVGVSLLAILDIREVFLLSCLISLLGLWIMLQAAKGFPSKCEF